MTLKTDLAVLIREHLLPLPGTAKVSLAAREPVPLDASDERVCFVESGCVRLLLEGKAGRQIVLWHVLAGEVFNEGILFDETRGYGLAEAREGSVVAAFRPEVFVEFLSGTAGAWAALTSLVLRRQAQLREKVHLLFLADVKERILRCLPSLAASIGSVDADGLTQVIHLTQQDLAAIIGATRETTSSALNDLARQGFLTIGRRTLRFRPPLEAAAGAR